MGLWEFRALVSSKNDRRWYWYTLAIWPDKQGKETKWDTNYAEAILQWGADIDVGA